MVCTDKQKVWVHVKPYRKRVWKCFDQKGKITKRLNVADFVRAPRKTKGPRRSKRRIQLKPPAARRARPEPPAEKLIVKLPFHKGRKKVTSFPVSKGSIKYAEDYQLQEPTQFGSKRKRRPGKTKDDPILLD